MEPDVKLIITDIDGTFIADDESIPKVNMDALAACHAAGIPVCPCTARPWIRAQDAIVPAGFSDACIVLNGSVIFDCKDGSILYQNTIAPSEVEPLLKVILKHSSTVMVNRPDKFVAYTGAMEAVKDGGRLSGFPSPDRIAKIGVLTNTFSDFVTEANKGCCVIRVIVDLAHRPLLEREIAALGPYVVTSDNDWSVHVLAPGAGKAAGIEELCKYYGVERQNILAFGDGENDISMLKWAGVGVAMANAGDAVKAAADHIAPSNNEGGFGKTVLDLVF